MRIIICGAGQVGTGIATQLASEENDITVIDMSPELIAEIADKLEVKTVTGFASYPNVLEEAGAAEADMVIAVTYSDEVNMVVCQVAHSIFNVPFKIARIRNQNYLDPLWKELYQHDHLPIDVIISPEKEVARVIYDRLHVPGAVDLIPFGDGYMKVLAIRCTLDSPMRNFPLYKVQQSIAKHNASIIGVVRGGDFLIAEADEPLLFNDEIYFVAESKHVPSIMSLFGYEGREARRIIIVGGGNIGLFLAEQLEKSEHDAIIKVVEVNKTRAEYIAQRLSSRTTVINGSALDQSILEESGFEHTEMLIAVSNDDKVNILSSLLAKRLGCQKAVTLLNNNIAYGPLVTSLGVDMTVSPKDTTVSGILRHVRMGKIRSVRAICGGKIEIMEAEAMEASPVIGARVGDLDLSDDVMLVAVMRHSQMLLPDEETIIQVGDRIVLLCKASMVRKVEKIFAVKFEYF